MARPLPTHDLDEKARPKLTLSPCPPSYARLVGEGYDTIQEAFDLDLSPAFVDLLEEAQKLAREADKRLRGLASITMHDETALMRAVGTRGFKWVLETNEFLILIAPPGTDWPVTVRYLAAGLWQFGVEELRIRAMRLLGNYAPPRQDDFMRVTRVDYAFDFHSPGFGKEFRAALVEGIVCPAGVKGSLWFARRRGETLYIGSKTGLQISLYNKSREITDKNGRGFMYEVWASSSDGLVIDADVYRVEVRMSGDFLKDRNIRRSHEVKAQIRMLIAEALCSRRLAVPQYRKDGSFTKRRARWPLHPFWSEALRSTGAHEMVPLGRIVTGARAALVERSRAQIAGTLLSHMMLEHGDWNEERILKELADVIVPSVIKNPKFLKTCEQLELRYSGVEDVK